MIKKPDNQAVAIILFTLAEMIALRSGISAILKGANLGALFPNDPTYNIFVLLVAGAIGYLVAKLLFQKRNAKFSVKLAVAVSVVLGTFIFSYWVSMVIYRSMANL